MAFAQMENLKYFVEFKRSGGQADIVSSISFATQQSLETYIWYWARGLEFSKAISQEHPGVLVVENFSHST